MIRPDVLNSERPYGPWGSRASDVWSTFVAAEAGDAPALSRLLERDPNLARADYWYTRPIHLAVREGHLEATSVLLEAGGGTVSLVVNEDLVAVARDHGHEGVARFVEEFRSRSARGVARGSEGLPEPASARLGTALHEAASAGDRALVEKLLAQGADPNFHLDSAGSATYAAKTPEIRTLLLRAAASWTPSTSSGSVKTTRSSAASSPTRARRIRAAVECSPPHVSSVSATCWSGCSMPARACRRF